MYVGANVKRWDARHTYLTVGCSSYPGVDPTN